MACPAPFAKIFLFASNPNQFTESHRPVPQRGDRASSRARGGMRWTRQRRAMSGDGRAGHKARELTNGTLDERRLARRSLWLRRSAADGEDVWFWHPLLVSSSRRLVAQPGIDETLIRG